MPSKKKKYNARFPPARIKKIMQSDEEVGKVAQAVPVIISRALELFVESLLKKAETVTQSRNAKTLTPSHLKQCILSEGKFDFLKELVATVPDVQGEEDLAETPTPRSSASNQAFLYPPPANPSVPSPTLSRRNSVQGPSSALGAPLTEQQEITTVKKEGNGDHYQQHPIADYAQDLPPIHPQQHKSVIVPHPQHLLHQEQQSYILNPAGVTGNPYISTISSSSGANHPVYPVYSHLQNPNGMNSSSSQNSAGPGSSSGVIVHDNKNMQQYQH